MRANPNGTSRGPQQEARWYSSTEFVGDFAVIPVRIVRKLRSEKSRLVILIAEEPGWPEVELAPVAAIGYEPDDSARMLNIELDFIDIFDQRD